jgi:hypothetical protein
MQELEPYVQTAEELRKLNQGEPEWLMARRGKVTASRCADLTAKIKSGKYASCHYNYLMELVSEHITGRCVEHFVTPAMEIGIEREPFARAAYEVSQDCSVETVGLVLHPTIELFASSPDGLVGDAGLVEFKCPTDRVHLEYLRDGVIPEDYVPQLTAQLACMPERKWNDFVSFNPNMPYGMQLFIRRLKRDEKAVAELEKEVQLFLGELAEMMNSLAQAVPILETA